MDQRGEVEFVLEDGSALLGEDEVMDFTADRMPRWAIALGVLGVAALVAALGWHVRDSPAAITPPAASVPPAAPSPSSSGLGTPLAIGPASRAGGVAGTAPLYLLQPGRLYKITASSTSGVTLDGPGFARLTSSRLVLDTAANRVWAVVLDIPGGEIVEFDSRTLRRLRTIHSPEAIRDAAALGGHLYLAATSGVADLAPGAAGPVSVPGLGGYVASVAPDLKRARLLALVLGARTSIRVLTLAGAVGRAEAITPVGGGTLRVTQDGTIWLAGFGPATDGAVLVRLDPTTLLPVRGSPLAAQLGPSGWIESAGDRVIWIRTGGDGEALWCVDGRDGRFLQYWPRVPGTVTSRSGSAYAVIDGALVPLIMNRCAG
ncbi:MAG: hypothetical protein DLM57_12615 [Pseudonocardiales bacterium]|nr:MAG: hypothetical protein DLM57_12615 [Pseudonocardiales bacterium]